jgi:hypothetical protein
MKKYILLIAAFGSTFYGAMAGNGIAPNNTETKATTTKQWLFKPLAANDVSLEVERLGNEIMIYLFSQNMKNVESIQLERSKTPNAGYTSFKTIRVPSSLAKSKNYIGTTDDSPFNASQESYYRMKVVYASGATKTSQWVNLSPITPIEPETVEK